MTENDVTTAHDPGPGRTDSGLANAARRQPWLAAGIAVVLLGAGFAIGALRTGVSIHTGMAYAAKGQISVLADDWTYSIPLDVPWEDGGGTIHFGERPSCLPPSTQQVRVRFASVEVSIDNHIYRQVVWVSCPAGL